MISLICFSSRCKVAKVTFARFFSRVTYQMSFKLSAVTDAKLHRSHLCMIFLRSEFSTVFSNCLSQQMQLHLGCRSQMQHSFLPTWSFPTNASSNSFVKSLMFPMKMPKTKRLTITWPRNQCSVGKDYCRMSIKGFEYRAHRWKPKVGISESVGPHNQIQNKSPGGAQIAGLAIGAPGPWSPGLQSPRTTLPSSLMNLHPGCSSSSATPVSST